PPRLREERTSRDDREDDLAGPGRRALHRVHPPGNGTLLQDDPRGSGERGREEESNRQAVAAMEARGRRCEDTRRSEEGTGRPLEPVVPERRSPSLLEGDPPALLQRSSLGTCPRPRIACALQLPAKRPRRSGGRLEYRPRRQITCASTTRFRESPTFEEFD